MGNSAIDGGAPDPAPPSEHVAYQTKKVEVWPAGTVGPIHTIPVPPPSINWFFGLDRKTRPTFYTSLGAVGSEGFSIAPDGWTIIATTPIAAGVEKRVGVQVSTVPVASTGLAYMLVVIGK